MNTVTLSADIPPSRELLITLPPEVPAGPAEIVVVVSPSRPSDLSTLGELVNSEFFGIWKDRSDIVDSSDFARGLRAEAWKRPE
jgi:hypothetical protein